MRAVRTKISYIKTGLAMYINYLHKTFLASSTVSKQSTYSSTWCLLIIASAALGNFFLNLSAFLFFTYCAIVGEQSALKIILFIWNTSTGSCWLQAVHRNLWLGVSSSIISTWWNISLMSPHTAIRAWQNLNKTKFI